jgi:hypothetical protein
MTEAVKPYRVRRENWPALLNEWVESNRAVPFAWKTHDCCSAAAAWVLLATGVDVYAVYAERYAPSMTSAMRIVKKAKGLKPLVEAALGDDVGAAFAGRGDVVLVNIEGRESLAVCLGNLAAGPGKDGLVFIGRGEWQCAWRV